MVRKLRKLLDSPRNDADLQKRQRIFTSHSLGNTGVGVQNHFTKFSGVRAPKWLRNTALVYT